MSSERFLFGVCCRCGVAADYDVAIRLGFLYSTQQLSIDGELVTDADHESLVGSCVGVAVGRGVVLLRLSGIVGLYLVEGSQNVVFLHQGYESVIHIDVEGEVAPLVANAEDETHINAAHVFEGVAVVFGAGNIGVVVVRRLWHRGGYLAVPQASEESEVEVGAEEEIDVVAGGQLRQLVFETCQDRYLDVPVVVEALTNGARLVDPYALEVGSAAVDVESTLKVDVFRPGVFPFGEHIVDVAADAEAHDGCASEKVVGDISHAVVEAGAIVYELSFGGNIESQNKSDDC